MRFVTEMHACAKNCIRYADFSGSLDRSAMTAISTCGEIVVAWPGGGGRRLPRCAAASSAGSDDTLCCVKAPGLVPDG